MKNCKVLTFCTWTSIGSILQSYGLKKALEQIGCTSTILLPVNSNALTQSKVHSIKSLISRSFQLIIHKSRVSAHQKRCSFIEKELDVDYYDNYSDLNNLEDTFFIAGSDQIWHPDLCHPHFFLDFVRKGKRISYAASMGKTDIPEMNRELIQRFLSKFDHISVREDQCRKVLQPLVNKNIQVHIDPTFLLEEQTWRALEKPYTVNEPYILVYMIYWDPACKAQLQALMKRTGLPVYAVCSGLSRVYADHFLFDVGVEEFLWLIDHAEYVVTSSFHGVAMSTIFRKKFSAVINPATPSRLRNLLDTLNIPLVSIDCLDTTDEFDYCKIYQSISVEREKGLQYLNEAIAQ